MDEKKLFNVVLVGEIKEDFDNKSAVKNNLAALFKVLLEKAEMLLKWQILVIKGSVDTATAARYKVTIERAGAVCRLESVAQQEGPLTSSPSLNEKELPKVIVGSSISESKRWLFTLIASHSRKAASARINLGYERQRI